MWLGLVILTAAIAVACATPKPITEEVEVTVEVTRMVPQTVEIPVTTVVQQTVEVPVTRLVPQTVVVQQTVEIPVTHLVTPTAPPRPTATRTSPSTSIIQNPVAGSAIRLAVRITAGPSITLPMQRWQSVWPAEAGGLRDKFNSGQRATIHPRRMLQNTLFGVEGLDLTGDIVLTPSRLYARFT